MGQAYDPSWAERLRAGDQARNEKHARRRVETHAVAEALLAAWEQRPDDESHVAWLVPEADARAVAARAVQLWPAEAIDEALRWVREEAERCLARGEPGWPIAPEFFASVAARLRSAAEEVDALLERTKRRGGQ